MTDQQSIIDELRTAHANGKRPEAPFAKVRPVQVRPVQVLPVLTTLTPIEKALVVIGALLAMIAGWHLVAILSGGAL
jgi:hypothetical protein